jgi:hypothetical protein
MANGDARGVFISYAHSDGAAAAELNGWLVSQCSSAGGGDGG